MTCQVIRRIPVLFTLGLLVGILSACSQSTDKKPDNAAIPRLEKAATQRLTAQTVVRFATSIQASAVLEAEDDYTRQMSDFDRCLRLRTDRPVSREEYRKFAAASAMDWDPAARDKVNHAVDFISSASAVLKLPLPPEILLIETDGKEESGLAYTRGNAVILPRQLLQGSQSGLNYLVTHEIFHILTRNNPELRNKLYTTIGFTHVGEIELPPDLRARKVTNPDSPWTDTCCTVQWRGESVTAAPILFSKEERYNVKSGGGVLDYLAAALMVVEQSGGRWRARLVNGKTILLDYGEVEGLLEKTGKNTDYIIQPEEILADNFAFMIIARKNLPSPGVVQAIHRLLLAGKPEGHD